MFVLCLVKCYFLWASFSVSSPSRSPSPLIIHPLTWFQPSLLYSDGACRAEASGQTHSFNFLLNISNWKFNCVFKQNCLAQPSRLALQTNLPSNFSAPKLAQPFLQLPSFTMTMHKQAGGRGSEWEIYSVACDRPNKTSWSWSVRLWRPKAWVWYMSHHRWRRC